MRRLLRTGLTVAVLLGTAAVASACPSCKDGSARETNGDRVMQAYEVTIYGLLAMPFLIAGTIGALLYRSERDRRRRLGAAAVPGDPVSG